VILTASRAVLPRLGAQDPTPDWGLMVAEGQNYFTTQWWLVTFPAWPSCSPRWRSPARRRSARRARSAKGAHPVNEVKLEIRDLRVSFAGHPVASVPS